MVVFIVIVDFCFLAIILMNNTNNLFLHSFSFHSKVDITFFFSYFTVFTICHELYNISFISFLTSNYGPM